MYFCPAGALNDTSTTNRFDFCIELAAYVAMVDVFRVGVHKSFRSIFIVRSFYSATILQRNFTMEVQCGAIIWFLGI